MALERFEYVLVKEENNLLHNSGIEDQRIFEEDNLDYIHNNEEETAVPIPNNKRIEAEVIKRPPSPDSSDSEEGSWLVPIQEQVLPVNYLQLGIKEDNYEEPPPEDPDSDSSAPEQADDPPQSSSEEGSEPSRSPIRIPEPSYSPTRRFKCGICSKKFKTSKELEIHFQIHTAIWIKCEYCTSKFLNKSLLDKHMIKNHSDVDKEKRPHKCSKCPNRFADTTDLEKHEASCKKRSKSPITCEVCEKVFPKRHLYNAHILQHTPDRPFACEECPLSFKYKSTLIRHGHVHNRIRPYGCPYCDKTFTSSGLLKPHLRVHTGEKPFTCHLCHKKFAHKHNMMRHIVSHEKVKHTICDICHREFPRESRLKYHMKTHVNEKYFLCDFCPKRFSHKQNVQRHYMRKHPGQTYEGTETDASVAAKIWDTMKKRICDDESEEILG